MNFMSRKLLASALILCHFDYACSSWYNGLTQLLQQKLQIMQNKVIRFVLDLPPRSHLGVSEFRNVNWLPVNSSVTQIMLDNTHRIVHGNAPLYMGEGISMVSTVHSIGTRHSQMSIDIPQVKAAGSKTFKLNAIKAWNSIPANIKTMESLSSFKLSVKKQLFGELLRREIDDFVYI